MLVPRLNLNQVDTRELDKELLLISTTIYTTLSWSMLQHYITDLKVHALSSCPITHPHVFSIRPPCFLHVPWRHTTIVLCHTSSSLSYMRTPCVHYEEPLSLDVTPNSNSISRLFPILLDPKSFQTALDSITWLPGHVPISYPFVRCRLIIN